MNDRSMKVFESLFQLLGLSAPLAIAITAIVLGLLSKRLGVVTHMPPYYRWFYVAAALACVATFFGLLYVLSGLACLNDDDLLCDETLYILTYSIPLALSLSISTATAWRYWGWLLIERDAQ